jgi:hypothetical protein
MDDFLLYCCFNAIYEGQKFGKSTPRYANRLRAMPHRAELQLRAMPHSAEFLKTNFIADSALCNSTWNSIQKFLVDSALCGTAQVNSALCGIAQSCDSPLCGIARSCNSALCLIARSRHKFAISQRNRNRIQKYFRMIISDIGRLDWWKKPRFENLVTVPLITWVCWKCYFL